MEDIDNWERLPKGVTEHDQAYCAVTCGWVNTETRAEVLVFRAQETGLGDVTSKEWAITHPWEEGGNTKFQNSEEEAIETAIQWMKDHPRPTNVY